MSEWVQGSIVSWQEAKSRLPPDFSFPETLRTLARQNSKIFLIVASHSCDIRYENEDLEPNIEFSVGSVLEKPDGNFLQNRNPRTLHTEIRQAVMDEGKSPKRYDQTLYVAIKAKNQIQFSKKLLKEGKLSPDGNFQFESTHLEGYILWLSRRYKRPAFPDAFNKKLDIADKGGKRRKKIAKKLVFLSGIYVEIHPGREIPENEVYAVNLLGILVPAQGNLEAKIENELKESLQGLANIFKEAGMKVNWRLENEENISLAIFKPFNRLDFDYLSLPGEEKNYPPDL